MVLLRIKKYVPEYISIIGSYQERYHIFAKCAWCNTVPNKRTCDPQKFMQPSPASHIHGVIHPGQGEPQLYSGSEYDADVCVV
jgi:hypothetical protein